VKMRIEQKEGRERVTVVRQFHARYVFLLHSFCSFHHRVSIFSSSSFSFFRFTSLCQFALSLSLSLSLHCVSSYFHFLFSPVFKTSSDSPLCSFQVKALYLFSLSLSLSLSRTFSRYFHITLSPLSCFPSLCPSPISAVSLSVSIQETKISIF